MLAALLLLTQNPVILLHRDLDAGRTTRYQMSMMEHLNSVGADVEAIYDEKVIVGSKGPRLLVTTTDFGINAGGQDIQVPIPNPHTLNLDKDGRMIGDGFLNEASVTRLIPDILADYALGVPINLTPDVKMVLQGMPDDDSREKINGSVTLVSQAAGLDRVALSLNIVYPDSKTPMHLEETAYFDPKTGEIYHADGLVSDLPPLMTSRYQVQSAEFKIKRLK